ncbi:MAG: metalloregulator ArsR/SmtB family transcription factor [Bacteroidales bacterium]
MAYSKTELFNVELQKCAVYYKALAHPARLAILQYLADTKTCITGDIADELPLSRTTVNQHLKELKDAGLITGTTEGAKMCYCLNSEKFSELKKITQTFLDGIDLTLNTECDT